MTREEAQAEARRIYGPNAQAGEGGITFWIRRNSDELSVQSVICFEDAFEKARSIDAWRVHRRATKGGTGK